MKFLTTLFFCLFFLSLAAGFSEDTLIKIEDGHSPIHLLSVKNNVISADENNNYASKPITHTNLNQLQNCIKIVFDGDLIITSSDQKLYCLEDLAFKQANQFKIGQHLLSYSGNHCIIHDIIHQKCDQPFFDITISDYHTYFVSRSEILVHNIAPVFIGLGWVFGSGAIEFAGATIGAMLCGIAVGVKAKKNKKSTLYSCDLSNNFNNLMHFNDAQAPGKPTENDGFIPPKNWNGEKVKHPKTGQHGWPDKKGNIWVPTGQGPNAHGGPHWDVVDSKGGYKNVVPGGKTRGQK